MCVLGCGRCPERRGLVDMRVRSSTVAAFLKIDPYAAGGNAGRCKRAVQDRARRLGVDLVLSAGPNDFRMRDA